MSSRRPNWRGVRRHRSYSVDEAARTVDVAKGTVRRWTKAGLPAITDRKPALTLVDIFRLGGLDPDPRGSRVADD